MVTRIGPRKPIQHYLREWRKEKNLTQQELADRLPEGEDGRPTGKDQISRWERNERGMTMEVQAALAEALDIEPRDLFRDPAQPSADELMKSATPEKRREVFRVITAMLGTGTGGSPIFLPLDEDAVLDDKGHTDKTEEAPRITRR